MPQCPRVSSSNRFASARWGLRLLIPWTTSTVVLPFSVRSRTTSNPCGRPTQSWCFVRIVVVRRVRFSMRPCPLVLVVATCPAGSATGWFSGGHGGAAPLGLLLGGAPGRYVGSQRGLVVLDREDVVPTSRHDRRAAVPLAEEGVAREDVACHGQEAQQFQGSLVLVGLGISAELGQNGLGFATVGGDQGLAVHFAFSAAAGGLAIQAD